MFLTYVIKVDKREVLRLYFKHICVVSFFFRFSRKITFVLQKGMILGHIHFLTL